MRIIGIDQAEPITICKEKHDFGEWHIDDIENSKISPAINSELIICADVIEHLLDPDSLLEYIKKRLTSNGVVVLTTPERDAIRGKKCFHSPNKQHIREWNFEEFETYLSSSGFEVLEHFLQYPVKFKINKIYYDEMIKRALRFKPLKYNQLVMAKQKRR